MKHYIVRAVKLDPILAPSVDSAPMSHHEARVALRKHRDKRPLNPDLVHGIIEVEAH